MKSIGRHLLMLGLAFTMTGPLAANHAAAQATQLAYSCKFVCGTRTIELGVVRGIYETSCNVHNPQFVPVIFKKKAVIALPERTQPRGPISPLRTEQLAPDQAFGVDCRDVRGLFAPVALPAFFEGFAVLYSPVELDVVGVYTAKQRIGTNPDAAIYDATSIDVQPVTPIRVTVP
jgi:hypothetical protein